MRSVSSGPKMNVPLNSWFFSQFLVLWRWQTKLSKLGLMLPGLGQTKFQNKKSRRQWHPRMFCWYWLGPVAAQWGLTVTGAWDSGLQGPLTRRHETRAQIFRGRARPETGLCASSPRLSFTMELSPSNESSHNLTLTGLASWITDPACRSSSLYTLTNTRLFIQRAIPNYWMRC